MQPRAGTARHDAVAWGFARGADSYGVDIIQNCEVTGIKIANNKIIGLGNFSWANSSKKSRSCCCGTYNATYGNGWPSHAG